MDSINIIKNRGDRIISQAICIQVTIVGIKNMLVQAVPSIYQRNNLLNIILLIVVGMIYLRALLYTKRIVSVRLVGIIIFVAASFISTFVFFPQNTSNIIDILPRALPYCFVTGYMVSQLSSFAWIEYYMERYSIYIILFSVISAIFIFFNGHITTTEYSSYSMPLSYVTLLAVMWLLHRYFNEGKAAWLLLSIIGTIIIILFGSRNPILAIVAFIIIKLNKQIFEYKAPHKIRNLCFEVICCAALFYWKNLLRFFQAFIKTFGIQSRTIDSLLEEQISTTGRDIIHGTLWSALRSHPIRGYGVLGDEVILSSVQQSAHSLYLSILSNYGYVLGAAVIAVLLFWNLKAYKTANNTDKSILLIYMCMVWPRGFTGGDIWTSDVFWWMLGMIISILTYVRVSSNEEM